MQTWTTSDIPNQSGRLALVTGTGGIGYECALALARAGCEVIIAGRNPLKGAAALAAISKEVPAAKVSFGQVDLADLASVTAFGNRLRQQQTRLDVLINNAAVMMPPQRLETADGWELQFQTNYLGHFALTWQLLPLLRQTPASRVVTVSSVAARNGTIQFEDLQFQKRYHSSRAYAQSKLACLMFALELQRRSVAGHWGITSVGAHPGVARTDLLHNAPGRWSVMGLIRSGLWFLFQPVAQGALPLLFAATSPLAKGGGYYGPNRLSETRGAPTEARIPQQALDDAKAAQLWEISERLAGTKYPVPEPT